MSFLYSIRTFNFCHFTYFRLSGFFGYMNKAFSTKIDRATNCCTTRAYKAIPKSVTHK